MKAYEVASSIDAVLVTLGHGENKGKQLAEVYFDGSVPESLLNELYAMHFSYNKGGRKSWSALVDSTKQQAELVKKLARPGEFAKYLPAPVVAAVTRPKRTRTTAATKAKTVAPALTPDERLTRMEALLTAMAERAGV
jgi:hypothetical protein